MELILKNRNSERREFLKEALYNAQREVFFLPEKEVIPLVEEESLTSRLNVK